MSRRFVPHPERPTDKGHKQYVPPADHRRTSVIVNRYSTRKIQYNKIKHFKYDVVKYKIEIFTNGINNL